MANRECREADCAHWLGKNLGCKYPDLDGCRISPSNCPEYISREDYQEQEEEKWVVEVRRAHALEHRPGNWCCVAQCDDGQTAITVADALQNFMRTGLISDDFHTRTRLVG